MTMSLTLKSIAERLPYPLGILTSRVPYSWRLGGAYQRYSELIQVADRWNPEQRLSYVIKRLDAVVTFAQANIPFYRELYGRSPIRIQRLGDFESLPVITRMQVREYSKTSRGFMFLNTGGSTGGPLGFYVDNEAWAREWAHMHFVWSHRNYKQTDLMATVMGKPIGDRSSKYNAVHNEFLLNPYGSDEGTAREFYRLCVTYPIKFFQGYPSNIYRILKAAETELNSDEQAKLISRSMCCFFSSEYPAAYIVAYLRERWGLQSYLSWYGHSEMCVLAHDVDSTSNYIPLFTYGFAEVKDGHLLGTSYHNFDMPLIRYQTEDVVDAEISESGLISSFRVSGGRQTDFVEDAEGRKLSLTFFLGRHHIIYNHVDFIQVFQPRPGELIYVLVPSKGCDLDGLNLDEYLDFPEALKMSFRYFVANQPVRTKMGKLKLKLEAADVSDLLLALRGLQSDY